MIKQTNGGLKMANSFGEGLGNILQNKLLLQYIAGAGDDISAGRGLGASVNAITQQNIQAQNADKKLKTFLAQLLGPDGMKATFSNKGINLTVPSDVLQGTGESGLGKDTAASSGTAPVAPTTPPVVPTAAPSVGGGSSVVNPFIVSDSSPSDLAGLSSQDIYGALGGALSTAQMKQDIPYKDMLMKNIKSEIEHRNIKSIDPLDRPFAINALGKEEGTTLREWNALPKDEQDYQIFLVGEKQVPGTKPLTRQEFKLLTPTEHERLINKFRTDKKFREAELEWRKAGATNFSLGDAVAKKEALDAAEARSTVMKPDFMAKIEKGLGKLDVWKFDNQEAIANVKKQYPKLTDAEAAIAARQKAILVQADTEIKQAYPDAVFNGKGWYSGNKLIRSNPYAR